MFAVILFVALIVNLAFYWLPETILGLSVKKVDLLADIRVLSEDNHCDSESFSAESMLGEDSFTDNMREGENIVSILQNDDNSLKSFSGESTLPPPNPINKGTTQDSSNTGHSMNTDNLSGRSNDLIARKIEDDKNNTNHLFNKSIEDFTSGRTGLRNFFAALNNIDNLGRPVRIAFVGDSFIEGDIVVADFRAKMQEHFGGRGVGFIPVTSNVAQYRPTIKHTASGWKTYSIINNKSKKFVISGLQFESVSENASIGFQTVDMYPGLEEVSSLKFIYSKNENSSILLRRETDTTYYELPPAENITQYEIQGQFTKGSLLIKNALGLKALGIALEDNHGVVVDNFALRGNSGIIMSNLDSKSCRELQQIRPYDLIVLQYGLNVASDSVREYSWYRNRMISVVEHVQDCFPGADILILGVSDRSHKRGGAYSTMPAVMSLLRAQRQTAKEAEVAFWSIFAAMGGQNSMVKYVKSNWASKDYTHLSFRGGREVANALYDAILTEKVMYDDNEYHIER